MNDQQGQQSPGAWQQLEQFSSPSSQFSQGGQTADDKGNLPSQQSWPPQQPQFPPSQYNQQWQQGQQTFQEIAWKAEQFPHIPIPPTMPKKSFFNKKNIVLSVLIAAVIVASLSGIFILLLPHLQQPKADVTVDFGNRQNITYPIKKGMFGLGYRGFSPHFTGFSTYLSNAGMTALRADANLAQIFPTAASATNPSQQQWADLDNFITTTQSLGAHPIIILNTSPSWLQPQMQNPPSPNPCSQIHADPSHVKPVFMIKGVDQGVQRWGELTAQVVAHLDHKFPLVTPDYEIWNEPDGVTFLCVTTNKLNAGQIRLAQYKAMYAAAAPLMQQQAQKDQRQISIGGPALAFPAKRASMWLSLLVHDPTIAPYIDFISYHDYVTAKTSETWSELLAATQDRTTGAAAVFENVSAIVRAGKQPNAQSTPIYIDEYNTNTKLADCCRNNQTYAPLWNAVFVSDLLNSVLDMHAHDGAAQAVPARMLYFTANRYESQFCMFGSIDAKMDCSPGANIQPYPQYYTYQLLNDPAFLGLSNGGHVASAPAVATSTNASGLLMTDFFTSGKNNVLIVNTSGQNYQQFNLSIQHPGNVNTSASVFILNQAHPHIGMQQVSLSSVNDGYIVPVDIPAYSIVALSLEMAS